MKVASLLLILIIVTNAALFISVQEANAASVRNTNLIPLEPQIWYFDGDQDGYGDAGKSVIDTIAPLNFVADNTDCNDANAGIHPGATEVCNEVDDNCNGENDEGLKSNYYFDNDLDGFGNPDSSVLACYAPQGFVADNTDCDDENAAMNPGATETCNDVDDNCNGEIDEGLKSVYYADSDQDGFGNPSATVTSCSLPGGYVIDNTDCNDANSSIHPNNTDACNNVDDDCDGTIDEDATFTLYYDDADHDGYGSQNALPASLCSNPGIGYATNNSDCNDLNSAVNPGVNEVCNQVDDNCNGSIDEGLQTTFYADADHDGYGNQSSSILACTQPSGYVTDHSDCNDNNNLIHPLAQEICNGIDDDCNGQIDNGITNTDVNISWQKSFGGSGSEEAMAMDITPDGSYIMAGYTTSNSGDVSGNHGDYDFWVTKTDAAGNLLWQKCYGGSSKDYAYDIRYTSDSGFIVVGSCSSVDGNVTGNHGSGDFWAIKLDKYGNLQWQKCLGGTKPDLCYAVCTTRDGGYVLAGTTYSGDGDLTGNHLSGDYWIVKLRNDGSVAWKKTYGGSAFDFAHAIIQSNDGGYVASGYARSTDGDVVGNHGQEDMWIIKLDSLGNLVWQKSYGGTGGEGANYLQKTSDGGYILTGVTHSYNLDVVGNNGNHDIWVVKIDGSGNKQWSKCLGGSDNDEGHYVRQTSDGGYLVAGNSQSSDGLVTKNNGKHDYYIVKLNSSGSLMWQKSLGGSMEDEPFSIAENTDGSFAVVGYSASNDKDVSGNHGSEDFWLVKCWVPSLSTYFADVDGDGYGTSSNSITSCSSPPGYVTNSLDCNDGNAAVHPGATEICNSIDDDCNNLTDEDSLFATISPLATVTICNTSSLTLQANTGASLTYQWMRNSLNISGATNSTYTTGSAGTYSVNVKQGSCSATSPGTILKTTNKIINVSPPGITKVCPLINVPFSIIANPGLAFQWHNSTNAIAGATGPNYTTSAPGNYYVTISDITGCTFNTSTSTLQNYPAVTASITLSGSLNICSSGSVTLKASVKTGYTYKWYKDNIVISGATGTIYVATQSGSYKYLATNSNGCTAFSASKSVSGCREEEGNNSNSNAKLKIYPNPNDGSFMIDLKLEDSFNGEGILSIYNPLGQIIQSETASISDGNFQVHVQLANEIARGIYLVKLSSGNHEWYSRVIISR